MANPRPTVIVLLQSNDSSQHVSSIAMLSFPFPPLRQKCSFSGPCSPPKRGATNPPCSAPPQGPFFYSCPPRPQRPDGNVRSADWQSANLRR